MKTILFALAFMATTACQTTPNQVQELKTEQLDVKGQTSTGGKIAINEKRQVIIVQEDSVSDNLAIQDLVNTQLMDRVLREHWSLKKCRNSLSDTRLGGSGDLGTMPDVASVLKPREVEEEMGVDENGDLKIVKKELLNHRLATMKSNTKTMEKMINTLTPMVEECERRLGNARLDHGLPSERFVAQGYFTADGTWVETRHAEHSLSDGYEISAQNGKKHN